jgi:hypothetical protein
MKTLQVSTDNQVNPLVPFDLPVGLYVGTLSFSVNSSPDAADTAPAAIATGLDNGAPSAQVPRAFGDPVRDQGGVIFAHQVFAVARQGMAAQCQGNGYVGAVQVTYTLCYAPVAVGG